MINFKTKNASIRTNIILPVSSGEQAQAFLAVAMALRGDAPDSRVHLLGVSRVMEGGSLSAAAQPMQKLRQTLETLAAKDHTVDRFIENVVSHAPWQDVAQLVGARNDDHDLLLLPWDDNTDTAAISAKTALAQPPCDVVAAKMGAPANTIRRI